jgi:hypothetical protein
MRGISLGFSLCKLMAVVLLLGFFASVGSAQQKGQYLPGQFGLNAGLLPDPGLTYANITINYSAGTLKDARGNAVPVTSSYDVWAVEDVFFYAPDFKVLGGRMVFGVIAPTFANGSLTAPQFGLSAGGFGIADIFVQPITLGWKLKRADIWVGDAFVAPTGRYTPGASNNIGSGYWGNQIMTGSTVYLTKNKGTTANLFTDWEQHGQKEGTNNTSLTPGQTFTMEWGVGQVLPLDKQFHKLLQLGVTGYDQWEVTADSGTTSGGLPGRTDPAYSVHAIGFQTNFIMPAKNLNFYFKFLDEYSAKAHPEGRTVVFGGSYTLRFPKSKTPTPTTP